MNGLSIQTTSATATLTDLLMQTASIARYIRLEARSAFTQCGVPEFQFSYHFFIGDNYSCTIQPFIVGTQASAKIQRHLIH